MSPRKLQWAAPVVGAAGIGFLANTMVPTADAAAKGDDDGSTPPRDGRPEEPRPDRERVAQLREPHPRLEV